MPSEFYFDIVLVVFLLVCSAFFSGSEVALFSLQPSVLDELSATKPAGWKYILKVLQSPRRLLVTILIGNTIVNTAAAILTAMITIHLSSTFHWNETAALIVEVFGVTFVIIVVSEVTPKVIAARMSLTVSKKTAFPLYVVSLLLYPITVPLVASVKKLETVLGIRSPSSALQSDDIKTLIDVGSMQGTIDQEERSIIHSMIDAKELIVREVMTPRIDMTAIEEKKATFKRVVSHILEKKHSRIPVFTGSIDNIIGILYAKDILPLLPSPDAQTAFSVTPYLRQPLFVPESKRIDSLLTEFQEKKSHIAIVVDEYGGTAGIITFQDVINAIVGELGDEMSRGEIEFVKLTDRLFRFNAKISITEAGEILGKQLWTKESSYDTLGGFLFHQFGAVPAEGTTVIFENILFTVQQVEKNRIQRIQAEILLPHTKNRKK